MELYEPIEKKKNTAICIAPLWQNNAALKYMHDPCWKVGINSPHLSRFRLKVVYGL
jgi:hypothetical protein